MIFLFHFQRDLPFLTTQSLFFPPWFMLYQPPHFFFDHLLALLSFPFSGDSFSNWLHRFFPFITEGTNRFPTKRLPPISLPPPSSASALLARLFFVVKLTLIVLTCNDSGFPFGTLFPFLFPPFFWVGVNLSLMLQSCFRPHSITMPFTSPPPDATALVTTFPFPIFVFPLQPMHPLDLSLMCTVSWFFAPNCTPFQSPRRLNLRHTQTRHPALSFTERNLFLFFFLEGSLASPFLSVPTLVFPLPA